MATIVAELLAELKEKQQDTQKLSDQNEDKASQLEALQEKCSDLER